MVPDVFKYMKKIIILEKIYILCFDVFCKSARKGKCMFCVSDIFMIYNIICFIKINIHCQINICFC